MAESYKYGSITVELQDDIAITDQAKNLTAEEVQKIPRAPHGVGMLCELSAELLKKNPDFAVPGLTPEKLLKLARRAEGIDQNIRDLDLVQTYLKQQNLLYDADAYEAIRMLRAQLEAQGKFNPELEKQFAPIIEFFKKRHSSKKSEPTDS